MKIQELHLKNFGKFKGKTIHFSDGINIVYGENESGKSTIHTFMRSMFFGMERGRGRASINDIFSHYEPWDNSNFYSGELRFKSGGKVFSVQRNFDKYSKKVELFCLDDGEELSVENGDLDMLLDGMTESMFDNTVSIGQLKAVPNQSLAAVLQNYATNYYASGDGELDCSEALEQLKKRRKEIEKDINSYLDKRQEKRDHLEMEASYIWRDVHRLREELELLEEELGELEETVETQEQENKRFFDEIRPEKWRIHPMELLWFLLLIILPRFLIPKPWNSLVSIVIFLLCGIYVWNRLKVGKKQVKTESEKILEEITGDYRTADQVLWEEKRVREELREKEVQYDNIQEQLEELEDVDEYLRKQEEKKQAVTLAENKISELTSQMQKRLRELLNEKVGEILVKITNGKYSKIFVEQDLKMSVFHEGKRVSVEKLSRGTLEQVYFALRMAAANMMQEEEQPVILDDTFVYYDDIRLKSTLQWLAENKKQVLIFTCQNREEEILKRCNISYNKESI